MTLARKTNQKPSAVVTLARVTSATPAGLFFSLAFVATRRKKFPPAVKRIFELGHIVEEIVVRDLKKSGAMVYEVDPRTKDQFEYTALGGHLRGHADGIIAFDKENPVNRDPGDEWEDALEEAEHYREEDPMTEVGEESMSFYEKRLKLIEDAAKKLRKR